VGRTVYQAAKKRDAGIKILSPGFDGLAVGHYNANVTGMNGGLRDYLQASDSTGGHWFDGFAIHTYNSDVQDPTHGYEGVILQAAETLQQFRIQVPIYTTETGYTEETTFGKSSLEGKATLLRRQAVVQAAVGVKCLCFYSHDDDFCGNPSINPPIAKALNDIHTHLAGKTLQQATLLPSAQIAIRTNAGSFTW
jgi:hypothetical protein